MTRLVFLSLAVVLGLAATQVQARPIVSQVALDRCIDVPGGSIADGNQLVIWNCHGGSNQQFQFGGSGEIRIGGKCVDAAGGAGRAGDKIILWNCSGGANQQWSIDRFGQVKGINSLCLDIEGGASGAGARLILWNCNLGNNQRWTLGREANDAGVQKKLYVIDGTNSGERHENALFHLATRFRGEVTWIDGVDLLVTNIDENYRRMYTVMCQDVKAPSAGGLGVREAYVAGYSRGAIMAVRLANEVRQQCGANVRFLGLVDAVNTLNWNWGVRVNDGISQAVHVRKSSTWEHVVTTRDIENVAKIFHRDAGVAHKSIVCAEPGNDYSWRWTLDQLMYYAKLAGASFDESNVAALRTRC